MIKYLGSKRLLLPRIVELVDGLCANGTVVDLFSGTARVGHALKQAGHRVIANDINAYAATLARCYVQTDAADVVDRARPLLERLNALPPGEPGYVTRTFCERARYFQRKNGLRIDRIRDWIADARLEPELESVLLTALLLAADRVDSTTGVQMAYLKQYAPRSYRQLRLTLPALLPRAAAGKGEAHELDAYDAARQLRGDVGYLDPPYNQHKYRSYYHVWETLVRWDAPPTYGVACKRADCREHGSDFNSRRRIHAALGRIIADLDVRHLIVSFNDEGYVRPDEMVEILSRRGEVFLLASPFRRYVGARIGIHDARGSRVGKISHLANTEYLFVVPARAAAARNLHPDLRPAADALAT